MIARINGFRLRQERRNTAGELPRRFTNCHTSYGWLSPRVSFSREYLDDSSAQLSGFKLISSSIGDTPQANTPAISGMDMKGSSTDFEFRLEDPVTLIPDDELFSDGKLVALQLPLVKSSVKKLSTEIGSWSPDTMTPRSITDVGNNADSYSFSPRAPRCSGRWRELLGLKKVIKVTKNENQKTELSSSLSTRMKSLKQFLHRSSKLISSNSSETLNHPLLKDLDCESVTISSSRLSLSSSSSGHSHDDLPRLSLDLDKPSKFNPESKNRITVKSRTSRSEAKRVGRSPVRRAPGESGRVRSREVSMDSPRMNSSGKIVFQSLERSSSSPSSFNGGPRLKHNGIERSYSANVRVPPVLNVPVSSLRGLSNFGFSQLFSSPQKRTDATHGGGGEGKGQTRHRRNRIVHR